MKESPARPVGGSRRASVDNLGIPPNAGLPFVLSLLILTSGCLFGVSEDGTVESQSKPSRAADDPSVSWERETWNGSAEGIGAYAAAVQTDPAERSFNVPNGTRHLFMNLTSNDQTIMYTRPPGCENGGTISLTSDCGSYHDDDQLSQRDPKPGRWEIEISRSEPGYGSSEFTLRVAMQVPYNTTG